MLLPKDPESERLVQWVEGGKRSRQQLLRAPASHAAGLDPPSPAGCPDTGTAGCGAAMDAAQFLPAPICPKPAADLALQPTLGPPSTAHHLCSAPRRPRTSCPPPCLSLAWPCQAWRTPWSAATCARCSLASRAMRLARTCWRRWVLCALLGAGRVVGCCMRTGAGRQCVSRLANLYIIADSSPQLDIQAPAPSCMPCRWCCVLLTFDPSAPSVSPLSPAVRVQLQLRPGRWRAHGGGRLLPRRQGVQHQGRPPWQQGKRVH